MNFCTMQLNKLRILKSPLTFILLISAVGLYAVIHGYMNPPKISTPVTKNLKYRDYEQG